MRPRPMDPSNGIVIHTSRPKPKGPKPKKGHVSNEKNNHGFGVYTLGCPRNFCKRLGSVDYNPNTVYPIYK